MDNGVQRRDWIKTRIEAIRQELDELLSELGAQETSTEEAEERRRKFTLYKGGLGALLLLLSAGYFLSRFRRPLMAVVAAASASVVAVAVLGHGPPRGAASPPARGPQPAVSASMSPTVSASRPAKSHPTSLPRPRRTPLVPVVPPSRLRRTPSTQPTSQSASGPGPSPLPSPSLPPSPAPSPVRSPSPTPGTPVCAVGLRLVVLRTGLTACV